MHAEKRDLLEGPIKRCSVCSWKPITTSFVPYLARIQCLLSSLNLGDRFST